MRWVNAVPVGSEGQPTNFGQIIDQLGEEGALPVAADLIGLTKAWQKTATVVGGEYREHGRHTHPGDLCGAW